MYTSIDDTAKVYPMDVMAERNEPLTIKAAQDDDWLFA